MKQIYYILCAAILLSGCQKDFGSEGGLDADRLVFNASLDGVSIVENRAAGVDADLITNGFYLAGYHTEGLINDAHATAYPNVFDKDAADNQAAVPLVSYTNGKFTLKTIKWLLDDVTYLSFFGWSQSTPFVAAVDASTTGIIGQTYYNNSDKGYPWIEIRNADAPLDQTDVVGTRSINHKNDAVLSAVDLNFQHLLSKLSFKAKSSKGADITITAVNIKYAANKVHKKARYTFGNDPITIGSYTLDATEFQAGTAPLGNSYPSITAGTEVVLGSVLLVPQELQTGDVSIELKYKLSPNSGSIAGAEQTKTLPLSAFTFEQGNNYTYSIDIQATDILVLGNPVIEDWNVLATPLPLVPGPRGDVLVLLDGYDKPYTHTDGKHYWLDRSGYNNHCEIKGYTEGMYNSSKHLYNLAIDQYIQVPALPSVTALSMDVVCQGKRDDNQVLFSFIHQGDNHTDGSYRNFFAQFGYQSDYKLYFDTQGTASTGQLVYQSSSAEIQQKLMWSFQKQDKGSIIIYTNGKEKAKMTDTGSRTLGVLADNQIGNGYQGTISYVKIMKGITPESDVADNYLVQDARHGLEELPPNPYLPPVESGLLYCYDARSGIKVDGTKQYWEDLVGQNHAEANGTLTTGTSGTFYYNSTDKCFYINNSGTLTNYFMLLESGKAKMPNSYTIELILKSENNGTTGSPLYWGTSGSELLEDRLLYMHYPGFYGGDIYVDAPTIPYEDGSGGSDRYIVAWPSGLGRQDIQKVVIRRQFGVKSEYFIANQMRGEGPAKRDIENLICEEMRFGGKDSVVRFYCVRFYNRALTDTELTNNYNEDKKNIPGLQ